MIAIEEEQFKILQDILRKYFPKEEIRVFGSRFKHTHKPYSDIDIAIVGNGKIDLKIYSKVKEELEESNLKYRVDLLDWYSISEEFQDIIKEGYEII